MCESAIVTGRIPDSAAIQGKGISTDADAVGVIFSGLDRVPEHQLSTTAALRIRRRPARAAHNQGERRIAACGVNVDRLTEGGCHRDYVSGIQMAVLHPGSTGYRNEAYSRCRGIHLVAGVG